MCEEQRKLQQMYEGSTWEQVGEALGVSGALARKVALGECRSRKVRAALGIRKESVDRLAARVTLKQGRAIREEMARRGYGSVTDYWLEFMEASNEI